MLSLINKKTILYILIAFTFSFAVRLVWVEQFSSTEQFKFNDQFMINTNDGYYYAEGARDIVLGISENTNDLSPFESATSILTAWIANILPISFESILFYMPAFFASLLVIPIILIGKRLNNIEVGFIAALISSITWSYYNRTMVGYYDTDMLNIVFPTLLLWSLIWAIDTKEDKYLLFTALDIIAYRWWYPQSYALEFAFFALIVLYLAYLCLQNRKSLEKFYTNLSISYIIQLLTLMMIAMVQIDILLRLMLIFGYFMLFRQTRWHKHLYIMFIMTCILFLSTGGFTPILEKLQSYLFTDIVSASSDGLKLKFFTVIQTIREAGQIPFETFANRISGHTITFIFSVIGYIWLIWNHRVMLLALPMVGLGFLALSGGLRFTIYAVPILALGLGYIIYTVSKFLSSQLINKVAQKVSYYVLLVLFTSGALYPNIVHVIEYKVPTVFTKNEVIVLDQLKNIAQRGDYVVSWWDYGYPIRYYSDVKTLSDGGKHSGSVNFPTSFMMISSQSESAKMARLDVEYTEKHFRIIKEDENKSKEEKRKIFSNVEEMTKGYGYSDTNDFLYSLNTDIQLPKKTRDIYLYLPNRMMNILPTISLFSNIDLMTGIKGKQPFFYQSSNFKEQGNIINLGNGISILKNKGEIHIGNQKLKINNFAVTQYLNNGKLRKNIQTIDTNSPISVIYMKNYNKFLVLDKKMYNSTYIQLFVFENYDKKLFEPVILTPLSKVYKLKI